MLRVDTCWGTARGTHTEIYRAQDRNTASKWKQRWIYNGSVYNFKQCHIKRNSKEATYYLSSSFLSTPQKKWKYWLPISIVQIFFLGGGGSANQNTNKFKFKLGWRSSFMSHNTLHQPYSQKIADKIRAAGIARKNFVTGDFLLIAPYRQCCRRERGEKTPL